MMEQTSKKDELQWFRKSSLSMRQQDDNEEWKKRRATPLSELHSLARRATNTTTTTSANSSFFDEGHTRIMASLVPDEIIYNVADYSKREFEGCLLFGDVSGFTDLCEKYNKSGKGGPSRLTQVLNAYIGAMVQEILSHSGDVLKFSGDAFIAMWKETDHLSLRDAVHEAIDCALVIQKTYGTYQTDVDVVVRVKLAVASGRLTFSLVGDSANSHYLMIGQPIMDIKAAESLSSAGEIIISTKVSHHFSANEYLLDLLPDRLHAKVLGVGPNWRNMQRHYDKEDLERYSILSANLSLQDEEGELLPVSSSYEKLGSVDDDTRIASRVVNDQYALRPAVNYAARFKLKDELRRFIIGPVMRGIDAEEPLEYLTEIRQVCIVFINCKVAANISANDGIDVANDVYVTVCSVVKNKYGCVNKISNFDKDLMLLVIFGLRGYKHELESQIALKCAIECTEKIKAMQYVLGIATGVTTGKCYCGAFGHTLRREYTVIGLVVNKAARLMVAYPNKVTCDRETFLHSKLESRNFFLQEYKFLKGIANPGPIYEFKGVEKNAELSLTTNPLPILGREQELDLYKTLFEKAKRLSLEQSEERFQNMLILQSGNRQGKSRLLEEIIYITDPDVPLNKMSLCGFDYEVPYRTIQWIFQKFINCNAETSEEEKQKIIRSRLMNRSTLEPFLCFLNPVFDVNFPLSDNYNMMDRSLKYETLQYIFRILCRDVFVRFWVIVIDDSENVDDESWLLIDILLDLNLVFIVVTMGSEKSLSTLALEILKKDRIKCVELKKIDKWYHVGLACQMLDVDGIPPELEKTIQTKSGGNPGWVESFLVSLMQSGGLYIHEMTRKTAYETGIVIAPLYMTMRLSKEEMRLWVQIMEERKISAVEDKMTTRWKMFIDSCRESYPDLSVAKKFAEKMKSSEIVNICTVYKNFNLEDVDPESAIDVIILKTFDALTSYEQLLLKCSAILGDIFPRDMLLYIMSSSAIRITALAVQKLFEIHVLSCAKGNFIEGGLSFKERLINPNEDMSVKCDCKGLIIDESCTDLPKYASCGYLRFRSSEFRETTYNLLTDNQKREFHERAIRYLEKETRRCRACGNGYFVRQMGGGKIDYSLRFMKRKAKNRSVVTETSSMNENFGAAKLLQRASFVSSESFQSTSKSKDFSRQRDTFSLFSAVSNANAEQNASLPDSHHVLTSGQELGLTTIRKLKDNFNLIRTFSSTDYTQCTCLLVLNTMYSQLIEHCKGAGLVEKIMNATVEYSYVCIDCQNIPQAIKVLEEALILLEGPMKDQIELEWMVALKRGKLLALLGLAHMQMDDDQCLDYYLNALKCYGVNFPKSRLSKSFHKCRFRFRNVLRYLSTNTSSRKVDDDIAEYCNNVSECLSFLCKFYIKKQKWDEAELAALWSLSKAVETETDFEKLCIAYANLIFVSSNIGCHQRCVALEVFALRTCHKKISYVELEELKAISFLYFTISRGRLRRAETEKFLHIAYVVWRVSTSSQTELHVFRMLPLLSYIVLLRKQLLEFSNMLQEIQYLLETDTDNSQKAWYYALCLVCHLETGLQAEPYSKCMKFLQGEGLEPAIRDPDGKTRLIICIWLWEIRNENWEAATGWQKMAWSFRIYDMGESIQNLITGLYLLEGLLIYFVHKMDNKNLKEIAKADAKITVLFKLFENATKYCKIITPRLYHMKAYYRVAKFNDYKGAIRLLKIGRKYADLYMNDMETTYMKHSELAWCRKLTREEAEFWKDHCDEDNMIDVHDVDFVERYVPYTL
ncbi:unnamed protein product, partial [Phaedon cochleariae]